MTEWIQRNDKDDAEERERERGSMQWAVSKDVDEKDILMHILIIITMKWIKDLSFYGLMLLQF